MKKCFIILQFGKPHEWTQKYLDHLTHQEKYGFYWKIFTPNKYKSPSNVEIVDMNIEQFNQLCEKKLGVNPKLYITPQGIPSGHVTDYMVFFGILFEDYLKEFDFWGLIGLDCVVGRLDHFVPDSLLNECDIYSDDINTFNGNFALMRNIPKVNSLFQNKIFNWREIFEKTECAGCVGSGQHTLYGTDEYHLTEILRVTKDVRFKYPNYFIHGHDRLEIHQPFPKLKLENDGSLWEKINDINQPQWEHAHQNFAHEIGYFHFSNTKKWPL